MKRLIPLMTSLLVGAAIPSVALAQANYSESFQSVGDGWSGGGGPTSLISRGWIFRNQSRPSGTGISPYWTEFYSWGQSGSSLSHGSFATWQNSSSKISAWIILPAIPNQQAGDPLSLWTSAPTNVFGVNTATLEIRYSASGGASTGSNENDVGNFTQLLMSISGAGGHPWTERRVTLPGSGRIAVRLIVGPGSDSSVFGGSFGIDSLQVGAPPAPPYPLPTAGQTVHWTQAHSPVVISRNGAGQNPRIVVGGTVIVDAGVEVRMSSGAQLEVAGGLQLAGESGAMVKLRGPGSIKLERGGVLDGAFADVQAFTDLIYGAKASFVDSDFRDPTNPTGFSYDSAGDIGHRFFDGNLEYARQIVALERCTFGQGCEVAVLRGWLAARDCFFDKGAVVTANPGPDGGEAMYIVGASILENVTVENAYIDVFHDRKQHRFIGDVTVTGNANGAGILLEGGANYLIDPSVTLQGNKWPISLGFNSAGILPGSQLPATGNTYNQIPDTDDSSPLDEGVVRADAGIPYYVSRNDVLHGRMTILPGVTVQFAPGVSWHFETDSNGIAMPIFLGEPERPITFTWDQPGQRWGGINVAQNVAEFGARWQWCVFEHAHHGIGSGGAPLALDQCVFHDNYIGVYSEGYLAPRSCRFENNTYSITGERFAPNHEVRGFFNANHPANPNTFIHNFGEPELSEQFSFLQGGGLIARARHNSLEDTDSDLRNNWWGTASGPFHPTMNPTGEGDEVFFGIDSGGFLTPFLTQAPVNNPPPVVRFVTSHSAATPGEKVHLHWTARDDGSIVSQRVYYSEDTNADEAMQLLAVLPPTARSYEWTVPFIGTPPNGADQFLRVVAVDDLGQEGIADLATKVLNPSVFGAAVLTPDASVAGATFNPGDSVPTCFVAMYNGGDLGQVYATLQMDNDDTSASLGGQFPLVGDNCIVLPAQIPDVSTDRARFRFIAVGSLNQNKVFDGPYFSIRPDPLLGDEAPSVALTSTHTGRNYAGGTTVPITWTASDDEALRSFDIRVSYNGGVDWLIVARDLPADARSYDWALPASTGVADARIRVVAKDRRFQNSSAESGAFAIVEGGETPCGTGDLDCDGDVDIVDLSVQLAAFGACAGDANYNAVADTDQSGCVDLTDLAMLLSQYGK